MPVIYPSGGDYREALFDTGRCFKDPSLVLAMPVQDSLGMPRAISGGSASVFTVRSADGKRWAIKCFTRFVPDQHLRYAQISQVLTVSRSSWQVAFEYLNEGVLCKDKWYPAVKMEWIEGTGLIPYIESNLRNSEALGRLAAKFVDLMQDLSSRGIAHGDLQHGNLLVTPSEELKLVDYDGMFVPGLESLGASEYGHPNYQSPFRTPAEWGSFLDNFSSWIIYASLIAVAIDPTLWALLHRDGDEALLFHKEDFASTPDVSPALRALTDGSDQQLQNLGRDMAFLWVPDIRVIPPLGSSVVENGEMVARISGRPTDIDADHDKAAHEIPSWLTDLVSEHGPSVAAQRAGDASWIANHLPPVQKVPFNPRVGQLRLLTAAWLAAAAGVCVWAVVGLHPLLTEVPVTASTALLFPASTTVLYRRTVGWRDKRLSRREARLCRAGVITARKAARRLEKAQTSIVANEKKAHERTTKKVNQARKAEQREISALDKKRDTMLAKIARRKQALQGREAKDISQALRALQQQHLRSVLQSSTVGAASIPGIGSAVASSLAAYGIRSAADFNGIAYGTGKGGGQQVYIRLTNGARVHPHGVGPKKAQSLESWRRSVEARARASQPTSLPPGQVAAIRSRFAADEQALLREEQAVRDGAAHEQAEARQKWIPVQSELAKERLAAQGEFARRRAQAETNLIDAQKRTAEAAWNQTMAERELAAYRNVTYLAYLACMIRM
jgi:hypothetical protein